MNEVQSEKFYDLTITLSIGSLKRERIMQITLQLRGHLHSFLVIFV